MKQLEGRIGIITGASAGIGAALARDSVEAGARVVVNARREGPLRELESSLGAASVAVVAGDAAEDATIHELFAAAQSHFGAEADFVAVNAGRGLRGSLTDSNTDEWDEMLRTNILGATRLMRRAAHELTRGWPEPGSDEFNARWASTVEAGGPCRDIVVLGSTVGRHISPFSSMYGSTKFAVNSLAEALRRELAKTGVRVTLIEPGIVRTEFQESAGYEMEGFTAFMDSVGPVLRAEDISRSIVFTLAQPPAVHVNDIMIRPTRQEYP
ncbi:MAG: SDR family oxidoreductase [Planctomycetota bacterium]